ncbi:hypothetical protein KY346_00725 [Candidatus Woesearchaeota archaeon]|nr:hypothetical protein [Candidatus Woesearchaeota archaeon]
MNSYNFNELRKSLIVQKLAQADESGTLQAFMNNSDAFENWLEELEKLNPNELHDEAKNYITKRLQRMIVRMRNLSQRLKNKRDESLKSEIAALDKELKQLQKDFLLEGRIKPSVEEMMKIKSGYYNIPEEKDDKAKKLLKALETTNSQLSTFSDEQFKFYIQILDHFQTWLLDTFDLPNTEGHSKQTRSIIFSRLTELMQNLNEIRQKYEGDKITGN